MVDGVFGPGGILDNRQGGAPGFLKRPVSGADVLHSTGQCAWPSGAGIDPFLDGRDRIGRQQFALGRHLLALVESGDQSVQGTFFAVTRQDHRAGVAAQHCLALTVEPQPALALVRAVAVETVLAEHRVNRVGEQVGLRRGGCREQRDGCAQECVSSRDQGHGGLIP